MTDEGGSSRVYLTIQTRTLRGGRRKFALCLSEVETRSSGIPPD
jgi:hypothetical protein